MFQTRSKLDIFSLRMGLAFRLIFFFQSVTIAAYCCFQSLASLPSSISVEMISQMLLFESSIIYILLTGYTIILDLIPG